MNEMLSFSAGLWVYHQLPPLWKCCNDWNSFQWGVIPLTIPMCFINKELSTTKDHEGSTFYELMTDSYICGLGDKPTIEGLITKLFQNPLNSRHMSLSQMLQTETSIEGLCCRTTACSACCSGLLGQNTRFLNTKRLAINGLLFGQSLVSTHPGYNSTVTYNNKHV